MRLQTALIFIGIVIILAVLSSTKHSHAHQEIDQKCYSKGGIMIELHPDGSICIDNDNIIVIPELAQELTPENAQK